MSTNNERYELNKNLAQMLKGGVIMDVTTPEQAKIAEAAGACAVMALERIPADIRAAGGVSRMSDPKMIKGIQEAVSIPVMAKCRIGHFAEAQVLQAIEIDYIDESEVLSPADDVNGSMILFIGREFSDSSPDNLESNGCPARIPEISLVVVPLFPTSRIFSGALSPCNPFPCTITEE